MKCVHCRKKIYIIHHHGIVQQSTCRFDNKSPVKTCQMCGIGKQQQSENEEKWEHKSSVIVPELNQCLVFNEQNSDHYIWKIHDNQIIQNILTAPNGKLKWIIELYPNGIWNEGKRWGFYLCFLH